MRRLLVLPVVFALAALFYFRDSLTNRHDPRAEGQGVVFYDRFRTQPGYTVLEFTNTSGQGSCVVLAAGGEILARFPGAYCVFLDDGGMASSFMGLSLWSKDLERRWTVERLNLHHDLAQDPDTGEIFAWFFENLKVTAAMPFANARRLAGHPLRADTLKSFTTDGKEKFKWAVLDNTEGLQTVYALQRRPFELEHVKDDLYQTSHFNSIQILPANPVAGRHPAFSKGNLLAASTACECLIILDRAGGKIRWHFTSPEASAGGPRDHIHSARLLANGNILYLRNSSQADQRPAHSKSAVIEIEPLSQQPVWRYEANEGGRFYGHYLGSAFRLENGNTLIAHLGGGGGVFEITRQGRLVWEWTNGAAQPLLPGNMYRARRVPATALESLIRAARRSGEF